MIIGLPLLATFTVAELRSVLAHELGHFAGGDTATASRTLRLQVFLRTARDHAGLLLGWFYRLYCRLYLWVSSASRRDAEYAADRLSARATDPRTAADAMRRVYQVALAWDLVAEESLPMFELAGARASIGEALHGVLQQNDEAIRRAADEAIAAQRPAWDDSHPPTAQRIQNFLDLPPQPDSPPADTRPAVLLVGREALDALEGELLVRELPLAGWPEVQAHAHRAVGHAPRSSSSRPCAAKRSNGRRVEMSPHAPASGHPAHPLPQPAGHRRHVVTAAGHGSMGDPGLGVQHGQQDGIPRDLPHPQVEHLPQRALQHGLRLAGEPQVAAPVRAAPEAAAAPGLPRAVEGAGAEGLLHPLPDPIEVDPQTGERLLIDLPAGPAQLPEGGPHPVRMQPVHRIGDFEGCQQQVIGPDLLVTGLGSNGLCPDDALPRRSGESFEHGSAFPPGPGMFLVHRLLADPQGHGDVLPRPPQAARPVHMQPLQLLGQRPQARDRPQALGRIRAVHTSGDVASDRHAVSLG